MIRTLQWQLKRVYANGERNLSKALKGIVHAYNSTIHSSHGLSPNEAEIPENIAKVVNNLEKKRDYFYTRYMEAYHNINSQFKLGDIVRFRLPVAPFTKEARIHFSEDKYQIVSVIPTAPVRSYKIAEIKSNAIVPGSYLPEQLILA